MEKSKFVTSGEVAQELGVSKSFAYKVFRQLNDELKSRVFLIVSGKVNRAYFEKILWN